MGWNGDDTGNAPKFESRQNSPVYEYLNSEQFNSVAGCVLGSHAKPTWRDSNKYETIYHLPIPYRCQMKANILIF